MKINECISALQNDIYNLKGFLTKEEQERWQLTIDTILEELLKGE